MATMYIDVVPNRNSPPAVLLRATTRVGDRTVKRTMANLSALPTLSERTRRLWPGRKRARWAAVALPWWHGQRAWHATPWFAG